MAQMKKAGATTQLKSRNTAQGSGISKLPSAICGTPNEQATHSASTVEMVMNTGLCRIERMIRALPVSLYAVGSRSICLMSVAPELAGAVRVPDLVPEHQRVPSIALPLEPALDAAFANDVLSVGAIGSGRPRALQGLSISFRDRDSVLAVINEGEPVAAFGHIGAVCRKSWGGNQSQYGRHKNCSHPANIIRNSERVNAH